MNDEQHGRSRTGVAVGLHQICESVSREKRFLVAEEAPGVERRESLYEAPCGRGERKGEGVYVFCVGGGKLQTTNMGASNCV